MGIFTGILNALKAKISNCTDLYVLKVKQLG
jgi:hypothetical protein